MGKKAIAALDTNPLDCAAATEVIREFYRRQLQAVEIDACTKACTLSVHCPPEGSIWRFWP